MKALQITIVFSLFLYSCFCTPAVLSAEITETITFPSGDGILITADTYILHKKEAPLIILFHQAGWSRGEYIEIAPRLNEKGFNCMAVDLRSGKAVNNIVNETATRAKKEGRSVTYADALPDMEAALLYARQHYGRGKIIAWGSSYSASLVLKLAGDRPEWVDGALAFAPGEYFVKLGKPAAWIKDSAINIKCPVFITSARKEKPMWLPIYDAIGSVEKVSYLPATEGNHGSRALWSQFEDSVDYWNAVNGFLMKYLL